MAQQETGWVESFVQRFDRVNDAKVTRLAEASFGGDIVAARAFVDQLDVEVVPAEQVVDSDVVDMSPLDTSPANRTRYALCTIVHAIEEGQHGRYWNTQLRGAVRNESTIFARRICEMFDEVKTRGFEGFGDLLEACGYSLGRIRQSIAAIGFNRKKASKDVIFAAFSKKSKTIEFASLCELPELMSLTSDLQVVEAPESDEVELVSLVSPVGDDFEVRRFLRVGAQASKSAQIRERARAVYQDSLIERGYLLTAVNKYGACSVFGRAVAGVDFGDVLFHASAMGQALDRLMFIDAICEECAEMDEAAGDLEEMLIESIAVGSSDHSSTAGMVPVPLGDVAKQGPGSIALGVDVIQAFKLRQIANREGVDISTLDGLKAFMDRITVLR